MTTEATKKRWSDEAAKFLVGKTITKVRYTTKAENDELGWSDAAIVLILNDGTMLFPSTDDEGNNAGALFTTIEELETIPVIGER